MTEKTVVILLSDKRSGSTMFQRELIKHSGVQTVSYSSHTYLETHHWLKAAVLMEQGKNGSVYKNYGGKNGARTYMLDTIKGNIPDFNAPNSDEELIRKGWDALCERFCEPVFFEKSPQILPKREALQQMLNWAKGTNYKVKVLGLVRNPMSVMYSASKLFHTDPERRQYAWKRTQENLLWVGAQLGEDQFLQLRYEDLIDAPQAQFQRICDFVGIPYENGIGDQAHGDSRRLWIDDPYFNFRLHPEVQQIAMEFGYGTEDLYNPDKPRPPFIWRLRFYLRRNWHRLKARIIDRWLKPLLLTLKK